MSILSVSEVRELDRITIQEAGVPGRILMEAAGYGAFLLLRRCWNLEGLEGPVTVAAGKGNNAGDGYVVARYLAAVGVPVKVTAASDPPGRDTDAGANAALLQAYGVPVTTVRGDGWPRALQGAGLVVDALLGTGLRGRMKAPFGAAVAAVNTCGAPVLALDIPSGLDGDDGSLHGEAVSAARTATFGAMKRGLTCGEGPRLAGEVELVPLPFTPGAWRRVHEGAPRSLRSG